MTSIARRSLIKGILATAAVPSATAVAAPFSQPARDAALVRHGRTFVEREQRLRAADARFEEAVRQARAVWPMIPLDMREHRAWPTGAGSECPVSGGYGYENGERQPYSSVDHGDLRWRLDTALERRPRTDKSRAEKVALVQYWTGEMRRLDQFEAECEAVRQRFGIPALVKEREAAKARLKQTVEQIFLTPAETIDGLAVKARVLESAEAKIADFITAQFKMPGSIARDIAWIAAAA